MAGRDRSRRPRVTPSMGGVKVLPDGMMVVSRVESVCRPQAAEIKEKPECAAGQIGGVARCP